MVGVGRPQNDSPSLPLPKDFMKMRLHEDDPREDQLHEIQSVGAAPLGGLLVETLCGEEKPSAFEKSSTASTRRSAACGTSGVSLAVPLASRKR